MRIEWKVTLVALLVLIGTLSAVVWKTQGLLLEDKIGFITDSSTRQMAPMKRLIQERLEGEKDKLVRFAASRTATGQARAQMFFDFDVVSLVQSTNGGPWSQSWIEKNAKIKEERWPAGYEQTLLKSLPYAKVKDGESTWVRVSDAKGSPLFALMVSVEFQNNASEAEVAEAAQLPEGAEPSEVAPSTTGNRTVVVGFFGANPLATVTEDFIGSMNTVYVVDERGYVASHVNKGYMGALFSDDSLVSEITKSQRTSSTGTFEDIERRSVIGHFERVGRTNLYAVVATPMGVVTGIADDHMRLALATGFGVGIFLLVVAWLVGRKITQPLRAAISSLQAINRGDTSASVAPSQSKDEIGEITRLLADSSPTALAAKTKLIQDIQKSEASASQTPVSESTVTNATMPGTPKADRLAQERRAAFETFSDGFVATLREPLLAIIGHSQLAKGKAPEVDPKAHIESIEREARRAKEVLERMKGLVEQQPSTDSEEEMDLAAMIEKLIQDMSPELETEGIKLTKDIRQVPHIRGVAADVQTAIAHVLQNAVEAMRARPVKRLKVQAEFLGDQVFVIVSDTGIGMSRDVKSRAFEPFFKKFESPKRMGLGLSFVQSTLKRHGAQSEIESVPGEGATFTFKFPVRADEKKNFQSAPVRPAEKTITTQISTQTPLASMPVVASSVANEASVDPMAFAEVTQPQLLKSDLNSILGQDSRDESLRPPPLDSADDDDEAELFEVTLGGRNILKGNDAQKLPPAPPIEEQGPPAEPLSPPPYPGPAAGLEEVRATVELAKVFADEPLVPASKIEEAQLPPPLLDASDVLDLSDDVEPTVIQRNVVEERAASEPPAGASVVRVEPSTARPTFESLFDDDDDDDDAFSSLTLSRPSIPLTPPPSGQARGAEAASMVNPGVSASNGIAAGSVNSGGTSAGATPGASTGAAKSGFQIKIRKPKTKA